MQDVHISGVLGLPLRRVIPPSAARPAPEANRLSPEAVRPAPEVDPVPDLVRFVEGFEIHAGPVPPTLQAGRPITEEHRRVAEAVRSLEPGQWFEWTPTFGRGRDFLARMRGFLRATGHPCADFDWSRLASAPRTLVIERPPQGSRGLG